MKSDPLKRGLRQDHSFKYRDNRGTLCLPSCIHRAAAFALTKSNRSSHVKKRVLSFREWILERLEKLQDKALAVSVLDSVGGHRY